MCIGGLVGQLGWGLFGVAVPRNAAQRSSESYIRRSSRTEVVIELKAGAVRVLSSMAFALGAARLPSAWCAWQMSAPTAPLQKKNVSGSIRPSLACRELVVTWLLCLVVAANVSAFFGAASLSSTWYVRPILCFSARNENAFFAHYAPRAANGCSLQTVKKSSLVSVVQAPGSNPLLLPGGFRR